MSLDAEFEAANRSMLEFIQILRIQRDTLTELLFMPAIIEMIEAACDNRICLAWVDGELALEGLWITYLDHIMAYLDHATIMDPYTGQTTLPDDVFMGHIETTCGISEAMTDDYRRQIAAYIGYTYVRSRVVNYKVAWTIIPPPELKVYPPEVKKLAEALLNGTNCGFALHDVLMEGNDPDLASHFKDHQPGECWRARMLVKNS